MTSVLSLKHFHDEAEAYKFVEAHVWPNGLCVRAASKGIGSAS